MQKGGEGDFDLQRCVDKEGQDNEEKRYDQAGRGAAVGAGDRLGAAAAGAGGGETFIGDPCEIGRASVFESVPANLCGVERSQGQGNTHVDRCCSFGSRRDSVRTFVLNFRPLDALGLVRQVLVVPLERIDRLRRRCRRGSGRQRCGRRVFPRRPLV